MTSSLSGFVVPDTTLSVAGLTAYIQALLEHDDYLRQVWVTGEVSSAAQYRSGLFFTLQDPDAKAAINCVAWSSRLNRLATYPTPGEQIILLGRVHVHAERGNYQLIVWQALPAGEGLRALRYRQLRQRLEAEGLFDLHRKRALPRHPRTIAVVTSPQAAAWGDIQRTLRRHYSGLHVLFSPALVQGEQAPEAIVKAIERVERDGRAEVMIVSRGGGAKEDMACFNDERVVRAIACCSIPIISGIGHQRDESLADLVADVCAHTPTAAAEQVVPHLEALYLEHQERMTRLHQGIQRQLSGTQDQLDSLRRRLRQLHIDRQLHHETQTIAQLQQRLHQMTAQRLQTAQQHCELLRQKLTTLDPNAVLRRGYALVRETDGKLVRASTQLTPGQNVLIQFSQGGAIAQITDVVP